MSTRTRYWKLWLHFVREMFLDKILGIFKVDTNEERADIFTKAMPKDSNDFAKFRNYIMNDY